MYFYRSDELKYPLTDDEYNKISEVWEFIKKFKKMPSNLHTYRSELIKLIKNQYSAEEFYYLELIVEKLFWNLRNKTYKFFLENDKKCLDDLLELKEGSLNDMLDEMYSDNSYRSFINKLILIDNINDKCYYKKIEGSSMIFSKNKFNLYTSIVLLNKKLYEMVMMDPIKIKSISVPEYYYQYDYPFPNLNYGRPFIQTKEYRMKRITQMYYSKRAEKNWFKLLKP